MSDNELDLYFVNADIAQIVTRAADEDDEWDNGASEVQVTVNGLYRSEHDDDALILEALNEAADGHALLGYDDIPVGERAWVVLTHYSTGDSFGHYGAWCIPAIKNSEQRAQAAADQCNQHKFNSHHRVPWDDYFADYENSVVVPVTVQA